MSNVAPPTQFEIETMKRQQHLMLELPTSQLIEELTPYFDGRSRAKALIFQWPWRNAKTHIGRLFKVCQMERAHLALQVAKLTGKSVDQVLKETDEAVEARLLQE